MSLVLSRASAIVFFTVVLACPLVNSTAVVADETESPLSEPAGEAILTEGQGGAGAADQLLDDSAIIATLIPTVLLPPQAGFVDPSGTARLNDTSILSCYAGTGTPLPCPVAGFPNQDAQLGRDATHHDNSDGYAGFNFTKISSTGAELPVSATQWSCVKDNVTGLMWEVKTQDGGLHDKNWAYTWYEPDSTKNGGAVGVQNGGQCGGTVACDTYSFVQKVNETGWCGAADWRLPTVDELFGLARLDRSQYPVSDQPAIDTNYFPNTTSHIAPSGDYAAYFSSSAVPYGNSFVWSVYFYDGLFQWSQKSDVFQVRLVRSGQ